MPESLNESAAKAGGSVRQPNLSWRILGAALAGAGVGVFFGESASALAPIGAVYIALLQMAVFPFLVSSLLHGLGSMNPAMAWKLFRSCWPVFVLAWAGTLAALAMVAWAIPEARPPLVITGQEGEGAARWVSLLVPANPFSDLTKNYVPAIVVFCVIYGIAIQSSKEKGGLLSALEVIRKASITIWGWVVKMAPLGVFALFADLAGTIRVELLGGLLLYLALFFGTALVVALWAIPAVLAALLPVRHRDLLDELRPALLMAVATSLPITAVPFIVQLAERLVMELGRREKDDDAVVATTLAVGYPLAQLGNLFVLLFMVFAGFYFQSALSGLDWAGLPVLTVFSTVGTPVSTVDAVAFLSHWLQLPADAQSLYVDMMTLTRYPQVLVSVMGIALVTILAPAGYYGLVRVRAAKLAAALAGTVLLLGGLLSAGHLAGSHLVQRQTETLRSFTLPPELAGSVKATVRRTPVVAPETTLPVIERIRSTGRLRVGYAPHVIPFSYFNAADELVGYDIAFVYALARSLNVDLELVPFTDWSRLDADLVAGRFDLAVGGIFLTTERLRETTVSRAYRESPPALIARTGEAGRFLDGKALREDASLRIAVFSSDLMERLARTLFPRAQIVVVPDYESLPGDPTIDAALWTLDQARAWASARPGFSAVVPRDFGTPFLMAYLMPPESREFAVLVDQWLELQKTNGFQEAMQTYWLEGRPGTTPGPRWSVLRDVLHWGK